MRYPTNLLYYFQHREHAGCLDVSNPHVQYIRVGHPQNGEVLDLYVLYQQNHVVTAKFQAASSVALIAASEFLCVWLEGKSYQDLDSLTHELILKKLDLTELNIHIANLILLAVKQLNFFQV